VACFVDGGQGSGDSGMTIIYSYTEARSFVRKKNKNLCGCLPELTAKALRDIASWNRLAGQSEVAVPKPAPPSGIRCECWPVTAASRCFSSLFLSARVNVPFFRTRYPIFPSQKFPAPSSQSLLLVCGPAVLL